MARASEGDFKHEHRATLKDAVRVVGQVHRLVEPLGYYASLYGSTLLKGSGHDVDVHVVGLGPEVEKKDPDFVATLLAKKFASRLRLFELIEIGDVQDAYVAYVTSGEVYVDVHVKGSVGGQ